MILFRLKAVGDRNKNYAGVEMRIAREDFIQWFMANDFPRCSVDRIDKNGHYEWGNIQLISLAENIAKDKTAFNGVSHRCYICGETKLASEFVKESRRMSGLSCVCKPCEAQRTRENALRSGRLTGRGRWPRASRLNGSTGV